jgi:predicted dienelactone hydrolase
MDHAPDRSSKPSFVARKSQGWSVRRTTLPRSHRVSVQFLIAAMLTVTFAACGDDDAWRLQVNTAQVLQPGPFGAGVTTMTFEDASRPTMANGTFPGSPTRVLVTEIWYPTAAGAEGPGDGLRDATLAQEGAPYPFVVYAHGLGGSHTSGTYLATHLASHGYVVAAPDFPLTRMSAPGGSTAVDVAEQPGDVRFLNSQLLALSADPASRLFGGVDLQRIGIMGYSTGGLTAYMVAFHPTLRDARVRAAASLAGNACFLTHSFFGATSVPLLMVQGDLDAVLPYAANSLFAYELANAPKWLVTITGGTHLGFGVACDTILNTAVNPDSVACPGPEDYYPAVVDALGGSDAGLVIADCQICPHPRPYPRSIRPCRQRELTILSVYPFFEVTLRGDQTFKRFIEQRLAAQNPEVTVATQEDGEPASIGKGGQAAFPTSSTAKSTSWTR